MKKQVVIAGFVLISLIALFLIVNVSNVSAININPANPEDPLGIGINPADIPQNPEDLANASANYLGTRWNQFFTESKVLGPIHQAFLAHPLPFKILFNTPYSFTLTFFCILFLWIFLLVSIGNLVEAYLNKLAGFVIGLVAVIVIAQIGIIGGIVKFFIEGILIKQSVWVKILLWIVVIIVLVLIFAFDSMWKKSVQASKKAQEKQMQKQKIEENEEFVKGVEEGRKLTEPLRKAKKKILDIDS